MSVKDYFKKRKNSKKGFTLVEMVASVCVLAIVSTVTVQVLFSVQDIFRHTSDITVNQYTTTQLEKFIRNELQIASTVELVSGAPSTATYENDEIFYYNKDEKKLYFKKATTDGASYSDIASNYLVLDSVNSVKFTIKPLKDEADAPLKFEYTIDTEDYQYSGGIVMGNTKYGTDFMASCETLGPDGVTVTWKEGSSDNSKVLTFHSEVMTPVTSGP